MLDENVLEFILAFVIKQYIRECFIVEQKKINFEKELYLSDLFPYPSYREWKLEAEKLLKGAPFDKVMKTQTCEGITLNAIYNQEDIEDISFVDSVPGEFPFVRGNNITEKVTKGWDVQQEINIKSIKEWNSIILDDLKKGQNSFRLEANKYMISDACDFFSFALKNFTPALMSNIHSFDIEMCSTYLPEFLKYCTENNIDTSNFIGSFGIDPIKYLVENGSLPYSREKLFDFIANSTKMAIDSKTPLKTILIDLSVWNDSGSSAVDDLGFMASMVTLYADELQKRGIEINEIFKRMTFIFAVSNNLFMEIAKLRAARFLFSKISEAYNVKSEYAKMRIHVRTSSYTKTYFDPWVNILRTTTEAFSAVIGGCDSLHITPFDSVYGNTDEFSRRIARNQQLILLEEAHLNAVIDPAGGSFYIEALTRDLIEKGWELFLTIEDNGGFMDSLGGVRVIVPSTDGKGSHEEACARGFIQVKIDKSHSYRLENAETRKDNIVGTSIYANLQEKTHEHKTADHDKKNKENIPFLKYVQQALNTKQSLGQTKVEPIPKRRLSETFENLRQAIENIDPRPEVFVVNIGPTIKNKPRVEFAIGFFEPVGFICSTNEGFDNVKDALKYLVEKLKIDTNSPKIKVIVLSSSDDQYPTIVPEFAKALKNINPEMILVLAGYPKEHQESFYQAGVDYFVYVRANVVLTVRDILTKIQRTKE